MLDWDQLSQESAPLLLVYPWAELHGAQRLEAPADDVRGEVLQLLRCDQLSLDQPLNLLLSVVLRSVLFLALSCPGISLYQFNSRILPGRLGKLKLALEGQLPTSILVAVISLRCPTMIQCACQ